MSWSHTRRGLGCPEEFQSSPAGACWNAAVPRRKQCQVSRPVLQFPIAWGSKNWRHSPLRTDRHPLPFTITFPFASMSTSPGRMPRLVASARWWACRRILLHYTKHSGQRVFHPTISFPLSCLPMTDLLPRKRDGRRPSLPRLADRPQIARQPAVEVEADFATAAARASRGRSCSSSPTRPTTAAAIECIAATPPFCAAWPGLNGRAGRAGPRCARGLSVRLVAKVQLELQRHRSSPSTKSSASRVIPSEGPPREATPTAGQSLPAIRRARRPPQPRSHPPAGGPKAVPARR